MCSSVLRAHTVRKQHEAATCLHVRVNTVLEPLHMYMPTHSLSKLCALSLLVVPLDFSLDCLPHMDDAAGVAERGLRRRW